MSRKKERPNVLDLSALKLLDPKCTSESCLPSHIKHRVKIDEKCDDLACNLKKSNINPIILKPISGPANNTNWLSNHNIDHTLELWTIEMGGQLFISHYAMSDFNKVGSSELSKFYKGSILDVFSEKQKYEYIKPEYFGVEHNMFACVMNTDLSTGSGKHWICMFIDFRDDPITIEFFDSGGDFPQHSFQEAMEKFKDDILNFPEFLHYQYLVNSDGGRKAVKTIYSSDFQHQYSSTECGVYALFYIRARITGTPVYYFLKNKIPDERMLELRKLLFTPI